MDKDTPAAPDEVERLWVRLRLNELAELIGGQQRLANDHWKVLNRCIVLTMACSLATLRIGREQELLGRAAGLSPMITQELDDLEQQIAKARATMQELAERAD